MFTMACEVSCCHGYVNKTYHPPRVPTSLFIGSMISSPESKLGVIFTFFRKSLITSYIIKYLVNKKKTLYLFNFRIEMNLQVINFLVVANKSMI